MFKCGYLAGAINITNNPERSVIPCCHVDHNHSLYNGKDLLNGNILTQMRNDALNGKTPELCKPCISKEPLGIESPRLRSVREFENKGIVKQVLEPSDVEVLYLKFSNLCNFKCVMCDSSSSHLIAKENGIEESLIEINNFYETQLLDLLPNMTSLRHVQITGGEPLLHKKKNLDFLSKLDKSVKIQYRTNGSVYDPEVVEFLKTFDTVQLLMSIDGQEDVLHYQRPRSNWKEIKINLEKYKGIGFELLNTMTITAFNIHQIPKFAKEQGHFFDALEFTPIRFPEEYRINLIQQDKLISIVDELKSTEVIGNLTHYIKDIESNHLSLPDKTIVRKFWQSVSNMKQYRGVDLNQLIPEMYNFYLKD
ncbi:twitch domain-containing radical SAM protein [bacterium]|nr:twitch domain-containing radical SAM protein [bacterium]